MNVEEAIVAFGETVLWVECDVCGRAYGGPGVNKAIVAVGRVNVCAECLRKSGNQGKVNGEPLLRGWAVETLMMHQARRNLP